MRKQAAQGRAGGVALLVLLALALAACDLPWSQPSAAQDGLPDAKQVLRLSLAGAGSQYGLQILDPARPQPEAPASQALTLIYSGLLTYDARLRPVPALADRVDVNADGLRYTFHIRRGARFSDGTPITSADAAFSIARLVLGHQPSAGQFFSALKGYDATQALPLPWKDSVIASRLSTGPLAAALLTPDPATLFIQLSRPDGALLTKLAAPFSGVVERSLALRYGDDWPDHLADPDVRGASGMFAVTGWRAFTPQHDMTVTLTRSATYWGERPRLRQIAVSFSSVFPSVDYQRDQFDVVLGMSESTDAGAARLPGFHTMPSRSLTVMLFNSAKPPLDDARARDALALALDRRALASDIPGPWIVTSTLIPSGTPGYMASVSGQIAGAQASGEPAAARALWLAYVHDHCSGKASACSPVSLCDGGPYCLGDTPLSQAMIEMWQAALPGIQFTTLNWVGFPGVPPDQPWASVAIMRWDEDFPDPQDWTANLLDYVPWAGNPPPPSGLTLARAAESAPTAGIRFTEYQLAQASLINNVDALPLAQSEYAWLARKGVAGFPADPLPWIMSDEWARVYLTSASG